MKPGDLLTVPRHNTLVSVWIDRASTMNGHRRLCRLHDGECVFVVNVPDKNIATRVQVLSKGGLGWIWPYEFVRIDES